jgi:hypothetical protein
MAKIKFVVIALLIIALVALPLFAGCGASVPATVTAYIGGGFGLTGAYPQDCKAVLAAFQDYAKYVNDWHKLAPWGPDFPENVKLQVLSMDDGCTSVTMAQSAYEELKAQGLKMFRISGTAIAQGLFQTLINDQVGATTQASGPYLLTPTIGTIFMNYPIYTDQCAAIADWFMDQWTAAGNTAQPRVAYLTNNSFGMSLVTTKMDDYLTGIGYDLVKPPQVIASAPPIDANTQLTWCKDNNIDLTLGAMTTISSEPMMTQADALHIGLNLTYNMQVGLCSPSHLCVYTGDMGAKGNGLVVAGSYPCFTDTAVPGVAFALKLQNDYEGGFKTTHIMYLHGLVEAMIQVDALRLALANTGKSADQLTSADILTQGFEKISNLDTGDIIPSLITYGPNDREGAEVVRLDQAQNGAVLKIGEYPLRHLY